MKKRKQFFLCLWMAFLFLPNSYAEAAKIVSVNGTVTEILCAIGMEDQIVGTDVTSVYPETIKTLPKVGHAPHISAEGILSLGPTVVVGFSSDLNANTVDQIESTGVAVQLFEQKIDIDGTKQLIRDLADFFDREANVEKIISGIDRSLQKLSPTKDKPKVLFIYARGAGTMMVGGKETPAAKMIELAGGKNAIQEFSGFKPLTSEALVATDPDIILLFESGLQSIGGVEGILNVQGVKMTKAGQEERILAMDGAYLTSFGPRVGEALLDLAKAFQK